MSSLFSSRHVPFAEVEPKLVESRRMHVGDVMTILDGRESDLVGAAVNDAALDPASRQPGGKTEGMVIAPI